MLNKLPIVVVACKKGVSRTEVKYTCNIPVATFPPLVTDAQIYQIIGCLGHYAEGIA